MGAMQLERDHRWNEEQLERDQAWEKTKLVRDQAWERAQYDEELRDIEEFLHEARVELLIVQSKIENWESLRSGRLRVI